MESIDSTAPSLLRRSSGDSRCLLCGGPCDTSHPREDHLSATFRNWSEAALPDSPYLCGGCVILLDESDRSRRPRLFSHLITPTRHETATKGEIDRIRQWCLSPPVDQPFAITIAVSGQKHLVYRTPVNWPGATRITVRLELELVEYTVAQLRDRLSLAMRVAAAAGKPALIDPSPSSLAAAISRHYLDPVPPLAWLDVSSEPLSRLAAFLCPRKEDCAHEHPCELGGIAASVATG